MKRKQHNSRLLEAIHETARDLHNLGFIDKRTMHEYDVLCVGKGGTAPDYFIDTALRLI